MQTVTGGGFGGKEDAPSAPGAQAALLAMATGRPVRLILIARGGHGGHVQAPPRRASGCARAPPRDGHLVAAEVDYLLDGGAYATLSPVVLFRGTVHACGPYRVPNVRWTRARCARTRSPAAPSAASASRRSCSPARARWTCWPSGWAMDPLELRRRNALRRGRRDDHRPQAHRRASASARCSTRSRRPSDWETQARGATRATRGPVRRGIGLAACYYGVGLGAMGKHLNPAGASVVVAADGSVTVAVGTTEIGQGMVTVLTQIAAEALGCPLELVRVIEADTSRVPDSGPTVASRTTVMSGNAIRDAAAKIRAAMEPVIADSGLPWREAVALCVQKQVGLAAHGWAVPPATTFDLATGQGEAYICYSFSANVVEVEVDTETGRDARRCASCSGHDAGRVINPTTGEGQVEGGVVQGLGYALVEEHAPAGRPHPERPVLDLHHPHAAGHAGDQDDPGRSTRSRGGRTAPRAWARRRSSRWRPRSTAAIHHATGVRLYEIPATPERVWAALRAAAGGRRVAERHRRRVHRQPPAGAPARAHATSACSTCCATTCA